MNMDCSIVTTSRNRYGDWVNGVEVPAKCHFRQITTFLRMQNMEVNDADAMIWFYPDTNVSLGSTVLFDGQYYEIDRLNKARRLGESTVQFIKCDLKRTVLVS